MERGCDMAGFVENVNVAASVLTPNNIAAILSAGANADIATAKAAEAAASEAATASLLDQFDDRYLGSKSSDPVVDNDGNALLVGALYWNSVSETMKVWKGNAWTDALTLTTSSTSTLTNKTADDISNMIGANHVHYPVRNVSGSTINVGTVVTAQGTQSGTDYVEVIPVTNPQTQIALGILHEAIQHNGTGLCMNTGVNLDVKDTSAWTVGTILYPSSTGGLTSTKPTTGLYQACAIVLRQHNNNGTLLIEFTEPKYIASTTQAGYVQLNNTLTSTSTTEALTAAQGKVLQDNKQPLDTTLTALAGVTTVADKVIYATGSDTFTTTTLSSFGRALIDDVDAATARATLGVAIGTNVQAYGAGLQSIAGLTTAADTMIYTTASDVYAVTPLTSAGRALIDDATAADQRTTLGLGSIAIQTASSVSITGGSITGITDLGIADGGTGASTAADARTNLGISATNTPFTATGNIAATNVQAALAELDTKKVPLNSDFSLDLGGL